MMMAEQRQLSRRNTRGLPLGLPGYVRGEEKTARFNSQARTRRPRPSKFARRVAASFRQAAVMGYEILYPPKPPELQPAE